MFRVGTCDSEYVGGSGSGSTPCPAGQVFTSSNGASTTVDDATCCKSPPRLRWASEARSRVLCARRCGFSVALIESTMFRGDLAARDRESGPLDGVWRRRFVRSLKGCAQCKCFELFRGGTCDSEYVGGSGSGSTPCPAGQVFTSSNGASTTVADATCCDSPQQLGRRLEARASCLVGSFRRLGLHRDGLSELASGEHPGEGLNDLKEGHPYAFVAM